MNQNTQRIYDKVFRAMQDAEEMGGPLGDQYMELMTGIASEAITRMTTYRAGSYFDDLKMDIQPKPKRLTFEEFQKTGRNIKMKDVFELHGVDIGTEFGRVYDGNCYIGLLDDGKWWLQICNEEYVDPDLGVLEERLYRDHYLREISQ